MSTPSGYRAWCQVVGLNPFHPEGWQLEERTAYSRWALDLFREKWHRYSLSGQPAIIREQSGREVLINTVRADLWEALRPLIRNPWLTCPCHQRVGLGKPDYEPWQDKEDYVDGLPLRDRLLRWLRTEFGRR